MLRWPFGMGLSRLPSLVATWTQCNNRGFAGNGALAADPATQKSGCLGAGLLQSGNYRDAGDASCRGFDDLGHALLGRIVCAFSVVWMERTLSKSAGQSTFYSPRKRGR